MIGGDELRSLLDESIEELYEHAPVAHMSSLVSGAIVKVNATLESWTGYRRDDLLESKRLHDLLAPGARIYYETHYAPLLQMQGAVREIALELVRADGSRLPVLMSSTLVRDAKGQPRVIRTTFFDASERRRYERELLRARADAELRARSAVALGHVSEGVVLVDPTGRIELLNPAAEKIFGVAAADVVGTPAEAVIEGWGQLGAAAPPARTADLARPQVVPRVHGGEEQWLSVAAVDAGDGIVYTVRDITFERKLEQVRTDLVAIVSHELRTPLTGVYGAATTLLGRGRELDPAAQRALLEMVVEQAQRLGTIVDQILLTSTLDTEAARPDVDAFDVREAFEGFQSARETHRVIIDSGGEVRVCGDLDRLRQAVTNLIDNALKYSRDAVHVRVERRDLSARITVSDEGPGIPAAEQEAIFEKFYRLDPDQRSGVGGTGLGLYIARELVDRMGGRIGLLRRERGATFYIDLPLA